MGYFCANERKRELFLMFLLFFFLSIENQVMTYSLAVNIPVGWDGVDTGVLGTDFLVYVPFGSASTLQAMQRDPRSAFYNQGGLGGQLASQVSSIDTGGIPNSPTLSSTSSEARRRKDALIGASAAIAAIAICVLIWWFVRVYKRRLEKRHKRLSEFVDPNWAGGVYGTHNDDRRTSFFYAEDQLNAPVTDGGLAGMWGSRLRALAMASRNAPEPAEDAEPTPPRVQVSSQNSNSELYQQAMIESLSRTMGDMPMPEMRQLSVDPPLATQPVAGPSRTLPPGPIGANAMERIRRVDGYNQSRTGQGPGTTMVLPIATTTALSRSSSQPQKPLGPRIRTKRYSRSYPQHNQLESGQSQDPGGAQPQASSSVNPGQAQSPYRPLKLAPKATPPSPPLPFPPPSQNVNPQQARKRIMRESISAPIFQFSSVDLDL